MPPAVPPSNLADANSEGTDESSLEDQMKRKIVSLVRDNGILKCENKRLRTSNRDAIVQNERFVNENRELRRQLMALQKAVTEERNRIGKFMDKIQETALTVSTITKRKR